MAPELRRPPRHRRPAQPRRGGGARLTVLSVITAASAAGAPGEAALELLLDAPEARCLDGSPAGIYWRAGSGAGATKLLIFFQGGGFCSVLDEAMPSATDSCAARANSTLGSSLAWPPFACGSSATVGFCCAYGGALSADPAQNPFLFDFNLAFIGYCDGSALTSYVEAPIVLPSGQALHLRGSAILDAVLDAVFAPAPRHGAAGWATQVVVGGCSAGGAAVFYHLDAIRARVPASVPVVGLADAGFLQDLPPATAAGAPPLSFERVRMQNATAIWGAVRANAACQARFSAPEDAWRCLVPQHSAPFVQTPHFLLGAAYDIALGGSDGANMSCATVFDEACGAAGRAAWAAYRNATIANTDAGYFSPPSPHGAFLDACVPHCQSVYLNRSWHGKIYSGGVSPAEAFNAWLTGGPLAPGARVRDDQEYPINPTCVGEI